MKSGHFALVAALTLVLATTWASAATSDFVFAPDHIKWAPLPFAPGAKAAWLIGPDKEELSILRVHLDAGAKMPPHTHLDTRVVTVLSGELYAGRGATFSEDAVKAYGPGTSFVVPVGASHFAWAKAGEVTYQEAAAGPSPIKP